MRVTSPSRAEDVGVGDVRVLEELALGGADDLVDVDGDAAVVALGDLDRLDVPVDHGELARPVLAHGVAAVDAAALHPVRPVDVGRQALEHGLDVARVERGVELSQHAVIIRNPQVAHGCEVEAGDERDLVLDVRAHALQRGGDVVAVDDHVGGHQRLAWT